MGLLSWIRGGGRGAVPPVVNMAAPVRAPYMGVDQRLPQVSAWRVSDTPPNVAAMSAPALRAKARDLDRNNGWAKQIVNAAVDDVVGWGPAPQVEDEKVTAAWKAWENYAGADGESWSALVSAAVRAVFVDGEAFVRVRPRFPEDLPEGVVPLQFELVPADMVPFEDSGTLEDGSLVVNGVVLDKNTKRVTGYLFLNSIPGDSVFDVADASGPHFVPVERVFHLYDPDRVKARRGVSALAAALVPLDELGKFQNAMRVRATIAASLVATHTPAAEEDGAVDSLTGEAPVTANGETVIDLGPGGVNTLSSSGEKLEITEPADFPVGFGEFVQTSLREAGAAIGVPYERFSYAWGAQNDRIARVVLDGWRRHVYRFVWTVLVPRLLDPAWKSWSEQAALSPGVGPVAAEWALHGFPYINPTQDVKAQTDAIAGGLISPQEAVAVRGGNLRAVYTQIAAAKKLAAELGISFDTKGGGK